MSRENAGYSVTDTLRVGDYELVIGEHPSAPAPFVCWYCKGGDNYFWGHYTASRADAVRCLCERANRELSLIEQKSTLPKQKSGEAR